jgi:glycoside/pentoside/hexuronide:cation symporter, GPH family
MSSVTTNQVKLPTRIKFIYGLGDWGNSAADTGRTLFWLFFLVSVVGLNAGIAGTIVLVGRLWDAINDPLVGTLSDRTRSRWGRRRPYFLFAAIPFGLSFILMFSIPPFTSQGGLTAYYMAVFLLFNTFYTLVNVPYAALTPELTEDYDERSSLVGWRMSFSILASLITGATFKIIAEEIFGRRFFGAGPESVQTGYLAAAVLWGITIVVPPLLLFRTIREPQREPVLEPWRPFKTMKEVFGNRPFRLAAVIYFLTYSTTEMVMAVFLWFLIFYMRVPVGFDSQVLGVALLVALLSVPFIVRLMRRFGKREAFIICMSFWMVVSAIISQVAPGETRQIFIAALFAGVGLGAAHVVPWAIVADVVEEDELRTGKRREGAYAGYLVFFRKLAGAVSVFVVGWVLSITGFVSSTSGGTAVIEQPANALLAIRIFVSGVPAVMLFMAIVAAWYYPLDRDAHKELRRKLVVQRAAQAEAMES